MSADDDESNHRARHVALHRSLDELVADFIGHTGALPSKTSVLDLMQWSFEQTLNPTPSSKRRDA
jgi:hypothetical protein